LVTKLFSGLKNVAQGIHLQNKLLEGFFLKKGHIEEPVLFILTKKMTKDSLTASQNYIYKDSLIFFLYWTGKTNRINTGTGDIQ